jgi:transposase
MRKQELLMLSEKDRDRLKVLNEVQQGHVTQKEAGEQLQVSDRWIRSLLSRVQEEGDGGVVHQLRGRPSNRRIAARVKRQAVKLVKAHYADFGPTLAAEYLARRDQIEVGKETLRQWLIEAGVWKARRRQVEKVHLWRPRRSCWGELVQWDTSEHAWLEGRGPKLFLVAMIDDATSRLMGQFVRHDSTEENLRVLRNYLERWGRPVAFYTDKASLFRVNRACSVEEQLEGEEAQTQIGRALRELGIEWIAAHSPQAKGRVERCFGTLQDRLVKGLRVAGVSTLEQANDYLQGEFLPDWEKRFTVKARKATDAHRQLGREHNLEAILSQVESRVVANDYTLRFQGQSYQVARDSIRAGLRGARVRVEQRLDGTLAVRFRDRYLTTARCEVKAEALSVSRPVPVKTPAKAKARSHWMEGFDLRDSPPLWKALAQEAGPATAPADRS